MGLCGQGIIGGRRSQALRQAVAMLFQHHDDLSAPFTVADVVVHDLQGSLDDIAEPAFAAENNVPLAAIGTDDGVAAGVSRTLKAVEIGQAAEELVGAAWPAVNNGDGALDRHDGLLASQRTELPRLFDSCGHSLSPRKVEEL